MTPEQLNLVLTFMEREAHLWRNRESEAVNDPEYAASCRAKAEAFEQAVKEYQG